MSYLLLTTKVKKLSHSVNPFAHSQVTCECANFAKNPKNLSDVTVKFIIFAQSQVTCECAKNGW